MSDQAPVTGLDTPTSTPVSDTPDVPWQKRYEDLRPEYDRTTARLRDEESLWDDEQAVLTRLAEKFPHLLVEDDDTPEPEYQQDDAQQWQDPRVDQLVPQLQDIAAWRAEQQYEKDLTQVLGDRKLSEFGQRTVKHLTAEGGNNRKALEQAVKDWFEYEDGIKPAERTPAPTPAPAGKAGEQDYNAIKDPAKRREARRARIAAQVEAGMNQQ